MLIAIEGIDGSGKGTQARLLVDALRTSGRRVSLLSFPRYDATFFGRAVGRFLNGEFGSLAEVHPFLVSLLFAGDRFESRSLLEQELSEHDIVVLDRYVASNIAHQGAKLPANQRAALVEAIEQLEFTVYGVPQPDVTILLDLPAQQAQQLIALKNQRSYTEKSHDLQEADADYLERVREVYLTLALNTPEWTTVSCLRDRVLRSIDEIHQEILGIAEHWLAGQ